ncbi:MAG: hypothetical protein ACOH2L_14475 [Devosia sp.]
MADAIGDIKARVDKIISARRITTLIGFRLDRVGMRPRPTRLIGGNAWALAASIPYMV